MRKAFTAFAAVSLGLFLASGAYAVTTNTGHLSHPFSGHHLTDPEAVVGEHVLYCPSEADDAALRGAIATALGGGAVVDYFDARVGTPSLAGYDQVFTWANYAYFDRVAIGNALADFVDAGGGHSVVLGAFCVYTLGNSIGGRIVTTGYCPVSGGFNHFAYACWMGDDATDCAFSGVSTACATYRDYLTLLSWGTAKGHFTDGEIVTASNNGPTPVARSVDYANGAGGYPLDGGTPDWPKLLANLMSTCKVIANESTTWGAVKDLYR